MVGDEGLEPPEPNDTRFTVWPATCYGLLAHIKLTERDFHPHPPTPRREFWSPMISWSSIYQVLVHPVSDFARNP